MPDSTALHFPDASFEELTARCNRLIEDPTDRNLEAGWALADAETRGCFEELLQAVGGSPGGLSRAYARTLARVARLIPAELRSGTRDLSWSHYLCLAQRTGATKMDLESGLREVYARVNDCYECDRSTPLSTRKLREVIDARMGRTPETEAAEMSEPPRCPKCGAEL